MKNINVFIVGTAGSGKSSLTYAFQTWMNSNGLDVVTVNLDPGAEYLPYSPDIDIREWVSLTEIMKSHNLGPNGAQIACADLLVFNIENVKKLIEDFKTNYVIFDTPGQTELFTFRHSSIRIIESLGIEKSVLLFLMDPFISKTPMGFVSELMLSSTVNFRFGLPMLQVLSKTDMIEPEEVETIIEWSNDLGKLEEGLMNEPARASANLNFELLHILQDMDIYKTLTPTSAETRFGMEDIYSFIQQIFEGGEDIRPD